MVLLLAIYHGDHVGALVATKVGKVAEKVANQSTEAMVKIVADLQNVEKARTRAKTKDADVRLLLRRQ